MVKQFEVGKMYYYPKFQKAAWLLLKLEKVKERVFVINRLFSSGAIDTAYYDIYALEYMSKRMKELK